RRMLGRTAAGVGTAAVATLGLGGRAEASTGGALIIGSPNNYADDGDKTTLTVSDTPAGVSAPYAFGVVNRRNWGDGVGAIGIFGGSNNPGFDPFDDETFIAVKGVAESGTGVWGESYFGPGLRALSHDGDGTFSSTNGGDRSGVYGENNGTG